MDNIYTPPLTRTVHPPEGHRRTSPNYSQVTDEHRKYFWTNINEQLLKATRRIKNNQQPLGKNIEL